VKRSGQGFLVVYSITNRNSFDMVDDLIQAVCRVKDVDWWPCVRRFEVVALLPFQSLIKDEFYFP
jgi:hypothetical protein